MRAAIWQVAEVEAWLAAVRTRGLLLVSLDPDMRELVYRRLCEENAAKLPRAMNPLRRNPWSDG